MQNFAWLDGTQAVTANPCIIQSMERKKELAPYLIVCIDSLERPISSVSTEDSLGPIFDPELDSTQQAIFERQKKRQIKNQTLIPNSKAPMPTVRYMACW